MKKIAIIIQRYGEEVSGGGEFYARALASHLKEKYDVTVLTTTSLELTFEKHYSAGVYDDNGVRVIRFDNDRARNFERLSELSNDEMAVINSGKETRLGVDLQWADEWGPYCPRLVRYVQDNKEEYDAFIVFTYIYYTTIRTIPIIKDKAIFIPTAHDEIWARPSVFRDIFSMPRYIGFLTEGERDFVRDFYKNDHVRGEVIGCGVDMPETINNDTFREKYNLNEDYIAYVGRVDVSKGCDELVDYFLAYKRKHPSNLKLVLIGGGSIPCPKSDDIIFTGFVSEQEKFDCLAGAKVSVAPSAYESLCIAVLESFSCNVPIMANGKCKILETHCQNGRNGFPYYSKNDFVEKLHTLLTDNEIRNSMGTSANGYLKENYTWDIVTGKIDDMIKEIEQETHKKKNENNPMVKELEIRNVFLDSQIDNEIIYANRNTIIEPVFADENAVTICLTSSDYFAPMCGVAVVSIIENMSPQRNYDILILTSKMSDKNKMLLGKLGGDNCSIRFVEFEENLFSAEITTHDSYSEYTYYRLMIPSICQKYKKVLYLDSDMVINHDVAELYDVDIDGYYAAAVLDLTILTWQVMKERHPLYGYLEELELTEPGTYMQGGVALYNTAMIDADYSVETLVEKANERQYQNCDQELLNMCFKGKIKFMPVNWNTVVMHPAYVDLYEYWLPKQYYDLYVEARNNPYIIHYSFGQIPCYGTNMDMESYFWEYARKSPFYEQLMWMVIMKQLPVTSTQILAQQSGKVGIKQKIKTSNVLLKIFPYNSKQREFVKKIYRKIRR